MDLTDIELSILKKIYQINSEGGKFDPSFLQIKETDNSKRTNEIANHLTRLEQMGYVTLEGAFVKGGRQDEIYHNNVLMINYENIKLTKTSIELIRNNMSDNNFDLNATVTIKNSDDLLNYNKANRQRIELWINDIKTLYKGEPYVLEVLADRLSGKFDVQWSVNNNEKNAVHLYRSNDFTTIYAYLKIEEGQLKSQGPRGINYENGKIKVHKCINKTKLLTVIHDKNVVKFTNILIIALRKPNEIIYRDIVQEDINSKTSESAVIESLSRVTSITSDVFNGPDLLDISQDVNAVSNLITLRRLSTPLSIGLFGNWGSGKSFFMHKMYEKIEYIESTNKSLNDKANQNIRLNTWENHHRELFCDNIVQIKFNAWHYMDTNLWASLVSTIFEGLSERFYPNNDKEAKNEIKLPFLEKLASTQEYKKQLENKKDKYEKVCTIKNIRLTELEEEIGKKKKEKSDIDKFAILKKIIKEENVAGRIAEIFPNDVPECVNKVLEANDDIIDLVKDSSSLIKKIITTFKLLSNKDRISIVLILVGIFLLNVILNKISFLSFSNIVMVIKGISGAIISIIGFINIPLVKNLIKKSHQWIDYLNYLAQKESSLLEQEKHQLDQELDNIIKKREKAKSEIREVKKDIVNIEYELEEIDKGKYIQHFIEKRINSTDYRKHLGIINLIRKDFEVLSNYLKNTTCINEQYKIERIILYIDDLDRCPPNVVVEVLQAIHLMLSFELFVVVVGVDVRWISKCLCDHYKMFRENSNENMASSYDYLEKIFQIPIKLQQISNDKSKNYINSLLAENLTVRPIEDNHETIDNNISEQNQIQENFIENDEGAVQIPHIDDEFEMLAFTNKDIEDTEEFIPILGSTPRTIKRFVNVYRLIKARYQYFESNRNLIFMISIITGLPNISMDIFREVQKENNLNINIQELINNLNSNNPNLKEDILKQIEIRKISMFLINSSLNDVLVNDLKPLIPIVSKYSFHLDDLN